MNAGSCGECGRGFLGLRDCPACGNALVEWEAPDVTVEWQQAATMERRDLRKILEKWLEDVPFPDSSLRADLAETAVLVGWPLWLVDVEVDGSWDAEAGFPVELLRSQERLKGGRWETVHHTEAGTRFERRTGEIRRHYADVVVPASRFQAQLEAQMPGFDDGSREAGTPPWPVWLPERDRSTAWPDAQTPLFQRAGRECQEAAGASALREFRISGSIEPQQWTLLLVPLWLMHYRAEDGKTRMLVVHGRNGAPAGARRASPKQGRERATQLAVGALLVGLGAGAAGLAGALIWPLLLLAAVAAVAAVGMGIAAISAAFRADRWNRTEGERDLR